VRRVCEVCGQPFVAQRVTARFCSSRCRSRSHAAGVREAARAAVPPSTEMTEAVRAELVDLGVDPVSLPAVQALVMAGHVDASVGAATSTLMRELNACMAEVRAAGGRATGPVDELRARRRHRRPRGVPDDVP
jgi:hypothetical protein